ncbi:hypothetical protein LRS03_20280 [Rhizobacter sp. J219]|uniref:hypothetical protein n=1 Tax=Rhizobacter sp. J219 TaxID=2898430 RepID=UPI002151A362|nr:hypothetical protein [Rhizobacter sp. J219]MCR5885071.1 hypothetical protein [Rhizobacter sp. J219]
MRNPWTAKNPFMSAWLSAANSAMGSARGHATAAARREVASVQRTATQQMLDFWSGKATSTLPAPTPARKRRKKR